MSDMPASQVGVTVWVAEYGNYVHGVFATQDDAEQYTARRWGPQWPDTWRIVERIVGFGAFDPRDGGDDDE